MAKSIEDIEGIGPAYGDKLRGAGVRTPDDLLRMGRTRSQRQELEERTGIAGTLNLRWVNMADLFRVKGVAGQFAELLESAGVDTVKELALRNADNLAAQLAEVNAERKLARVNPSPSSVRSWVEQARELPAAVEH